MVAMVSLFANLLPRLLVCLVAGVAVPVLAQPQAQAGIQPFGDLLTLEGERAGQMASIGDGQWTLVMIWASDCHVCKLQKPIVSAFHDAHKATDARVFGIALDGRSRMDEVQDYLGKYPASFPNYVGEYPIIAADFQQLTEENLHGTPTYLLFDPAGELKGSNPGPITIAALERFISRHGE